jgi:hypothetical protein
LLPVTFNILKIALALQAVYYFTIRLVARRGKTCAFFIKARHFSEVYDLFRQVFLPFPVQSYNSLIVARYIKGSFTSAIGDNVRFTLGYYLVLDRKALKAKV